MQVAKEAWEAAVAAEQRAREHKEALETLIENAGNEPENDSGYPRTYLDLDEWLDSLEIPADYLAAIPNG